VKSVTKDAGEAFTGLVREHQKSVFALAYGKLRNAHDAEDVMQEVFIEAYRNLHRLRNHKKVSGWLFKATIYRCKDHFRRKSRRQRREMEFTKLSSHPSGETVDDGCADAVIEAVGRMPEKFRIVIMLRHYAGLSYSEIAAMTGLSKTTIDGRLRAAKKSLRDTLTEKEIEVI